jgi:tellurite resistance protein TerC
MLRLEDVPPFVRRVIVAVIGGTILLVGIAMIVLPGPAVVVIPLGLAVLATEFIWARRWLRKARKLLQKAKDSVAGAGKK